MITPKTFFKRHVKNYKENAMRNTYVSFPFPVFFYDSAFLEENS